MSLRNWPTYVLGQKVEEPGCGLRKTGAELNKKRFPFRGIGSSLTEAGKPERRRALIG